MVNVTKENFIEQSNDFLHHLPNASFIAIDEEMTGISVATPSTTSKTNIKQPPQRNNSKDLTPAQRYSELKLAPEKYSIIQLGIALYFFHDKAKDHDGNDTTSPMDYHERPYDTHHYSSSVTPRGVTRLPSSPLRSRSNDVASTTRRGYTISEPRDDLIPSTPKVVSMYDVKTHIPPGTSYSVRRYNFYMFPDAKTNINTQQHIPRDIVMNVSTTSFLLEHNMSFDLWTRFGVPYATSLSQAQSYIKSYIDQEIRIRREELGKVQQQQQSPITIQGVVQNRVVLRRVEDIAFHARTMAMLRDWLDSPITQTSSASEGSNIPSTSCQEYDMVDPYLEQSLLLPQCNSFLRRALYESINIEYPSLILERNSNRSGGSSGGQQQIRVYRLNTEENDQRKQYLQQQRYYQFVVNQIGVYRIFAALRLVCNGHSINYNHVLFAKSYNDIDWDAIFNTATGCDSPYDFTDENDVHDVTNMIGLELALDPRLGGSQHSTVRTPIPIIVHNGFMDLCFLLTHFIVHPLPNQYQECKQIIHKLFPHIYDTKIIATECPCWDDSEQNSVNTNLSTLFHMIGRNPNHYYNHSDDMDQENSRTLLDDIYVVPAFAFKKATNKNNDRCVMANVDDQEHEAAYDAYMTGVIFIGLCQLICSRNNMGIHVNRNNPLVSLMARNDANKHAKLRTFYGLNKLYQMSIYTMDLEEKRYNCDPMSRGLVAKYTYRVSNIDPAITTRDVVSVLTGLHDAKNRPINFLIIWIDDTTFLVAASYSPSITQPVVTTEQQQHLVAVNDEFEEGEEVVEPTEADTVDAIADISNIEDTVTLNDVDAILCDHANEILKALRERFHNSDTTIVSLDEYLEAQSVEGNVYDDTHKDTLGEEQTNSWLNRMWSVMGWPLHVNTSTTANKKHGSDAVPFDSTSNKRQRIQ